MTDHFLGIDGGGTKTAFLYEGPDGRREKLVLGPSNPNDVGIEGFRRVMDEGIARFTALAEPSEFSVFCGVAGARSGNNLEKIEKILDAYGFGKTGCGGDLDNVLSFALGDEDGTVFILGTGSVAIIREEGCLTRVGGWGYLLGDEGSGYRLGRDALARMCRMADGREKKTLLYDLLKAELGTEPIDAVSRIYSGGKRYIASFAPVVFDAYRAGDTPAKEILEENYRQLAEAVDAAAWFRRNKSKPVIFCGGLTAQKDIIDPILRKNLKDRSVELEYRQGDMAEGALRLAGKREK